MGYTTLYRKFRPTKFEEIVGQEHVVKTIKNQIITEKVGHAYLFSGGRGTGKTSAAKILARAVNCLNLQDGEPCNECEMCKSALDGSLTDIVEMDAASNNSVEDVREIREAVNFLPTKAKYRVYIIDEVHMLSTGAFNALLKTLEEPPAHVKFILATTEPQKIPATILSRCQRFDFKRISNEDIIKRLKIVCKESKIKINAEALNLIATLSEGGMRDALSILERCNQDGEDKIDENKIRDLVGIPQITYIKQIVEGIIDKDVSRALTVVDNFIREGKDLDNTIWEIIKYVKDILLFKATGNTETYTKQEIEDIKNISEKISKQELLDLIYKLSEIENSIKFSTQKLIIFQAGIIKLCNTNVDTSSKNSSTTKKSNLTEKAEKIEKKDTLKTNISEKKSESKKLPKEEAQSYWPKVLKEFNKNGQKILNMNLTGTIAKEIDDKTLSIEFPNGLSTATKTFLELPKNKQDLKDAIFLASGKNMQIQFVDTKIKQRDVSSSEFEQFAKKNDISINVID